MDISLSGAQKNRFNTENGVDRNLVNVKAILPPAAVTAAITIIMPTA